MKKPSVLPIDLEQDLAAIGRRLESGETVEAELSAAVAGISALPPTAISQAAPAIADSARLHRWRPAPSWFEKQFLRRLSDKEQLLRHPTLSYLFLFHHDGRIRELALQRITGELPSPFMFAAVALRLNDWAEPVRSAAYECAQRCFPQTSPDVVAGAATALLLRYDSWGRWDRQREAVDAAFARPDVGACLADSLVNAQTGPGSRILRAAMKQDALDRHLERLAAEARQPSVRATAVQALADLRASWPAGMEWKWIDKSMGKRMRVPRIESREITGSVAGDSVVRAAAFDRSALVRKASLDALIRHKLGSSEARELALQLTADPSRLVRERAAFILSRHQEASISSGRE